MNQGIQELRTEIIWEKPPVLDGKLRNIKITWPIYTRRYGKKPPGGRLLRKKRLRKKNSRAMLSMEFQGYLHMDDMVDVSNATIAMLQIVLQGNNK